jgi:hypothetical protein
MGRYAWARSADDAFKLATEQLERVRIAEVGTRFGTRFSRPWPLQPNRLAADGGPRQHGGCATPEPSPLLVGAGRPIRGIAQAGVGAVGVLDRRHCARPSIRGSSRKALVPSAGAAREGSRYGRSRRRTVEGLELRTFGEEEVWGRALSEACFTRGAHFSVPPDRCSGACATSFADGAGSCVASFEDGEANEKRSGCPCGQDPESGPWRDRQ